MLRPRFVVRDVVSVAPGVTIVRRMTNQMASNVASHTNFAKHSSLLTSSCHFVPDPLLTSLPRRCLTLLQVSHVMLDPLRRDQLSALPLHRFRAAIVLADERWSTSSSETVEERLADQQLQPISDVMDQPSVLRQDALMVMVQVRSHHGMLAAGWSWQWSDVCGGIAVCICCMLTLVTLVSGWCWGPQHQPRVVPLYSMPGLIPAPP